MAYVYLLITTLLGGGGVIANKLLERSIKPGFVTFTFINLVNAIYGSFFLFIACKFQVQFNIVNVLFALLFAAIVYLSICGQILFLTENPVTLLGLTNTAGSLIICFVVGFMFFSEAIHTRLILSAVLMLLAFLLPYIRTKQKRINARTILYGLILFFTNGASAAVLKWFSCFEAIAHAPSMFFLTNLFLVVICGSILIVCAVYRKQKPTALTPLQHLYIGGNTLLSNITSILITLILVSMAVSLYTVLNAALTLLVGALVSKLIFKEENSKEDYIALGLAVVSIILSV